MPQPVQRHAQNAPLLQPAYTRWRRCGSKGFSLHPLAPSGYYGYVGAGLHNPLGKRGAGGAGSFVGKALVQLMRQYGVVVFWCVLEISIVFHMKMCELVGRSKFDFTGVQTQR